MRQRLVAQAAGLVPVFCAASALTLVGALALLPLTAERIDHEARAAASV